MLTWSQAPPLISASASVHVRVLTAGIALLYLQLHRVSQEASHLQRALDYVKRTMRILNGRRVTFLCGDAGPLAVGAVVHHRLQKVSEMQECLSRLLQLQRAALSHDSDVPDELLYGRAGFLYALLYVNKEIGADTVDEGTIAEVRPAAPSLAFSSS